ncbi:MAG: putative capsid protein [Cressdnaviricota sp.]|nr:MAG: putative capsid protein [Cressdnaviricota sp.]
MPRKSVKGRADRKAKAKASFKKMTGGLNKTEKKQTKKIAEAVVKKDHVMKYFDVDTTFTAAAPATSVQSNALKQISVLGYSSTTNENNAGQTQNYGSQALIPLFLSRPFKENNPTSELATNALNGQYILPKMAKTHFSMERVRYNVQSSTNEAVDYDMAESLPCHYRIIKVEIKAEQGTMEVVNPNNDLFIDQHGLPIGIDSPNFDRLVIKYAPINTKKYTKKSDIQGTIHQNNIITPAVAATAGSDHTDIVTMKNGASEKYFTVPFQLSARKNGKLFYQDPQQSSAVQTFTSGGKRQLVLMHFWFGNGHNLLGASPQPNAPSGTTIQIKHKAMASFVDAQ